MDSKECLSSFASTYETNRRVASYQPHGFENGSNYCYQNAVLQGMLAVPQFFNLFRDIAMKVSEEEIQTSRFIKALVNIVANYATSKPCKGRKSFGTITNFMLDDLRFYCSLEPGRFQEGVQEDACEFLMFLYNSLKTELGFAVNNNDGDFLQLQNVFEGTIETTNTEGMKQQQPFITLPVEISHEKVNSVKSALLRSFRVSGYDESTQDIKEKLDVLPEVMIIQLKLFKMNKSYDIIKKLKSINLEDNLVIPDNILSESSQSRYSPESKQYRLCSVIYHDGFDVYSGHYVTDAQHAGKWMNYNDNIVNSVSHPNDQVNPAGYVPYVLIYRRKDTCGGQVRTKKGHPKDQGASGYEYGPNYEVPSNKKPSINKKASTSLKSREFVIEEPSFPAIGSSSYHSASQYRRLEMDFNNLSIGQRTTKKNKKKKNKK